MRANLPIGNASSTSHAKGGWFARLAVATSRISGRPATFSSPSRSWSSGP